ncbi:MAG: hypothetical protein AAGJ97_11385 [Planctomycetota bacterium]
MRQTPQTRTSGLTPATFAAALCAWLCGSACPTFAQSPSGYPSFTPIAGNAPPAAQPWPTISPFAAPYQTVQNDGGIWFQHTAEFGRKKYATISALRGQFRSPSNTPIGALGDFDFLFPPNEFRLDADGDFDPDDDDVSTRLIAGLSPSPFEPTSFLALTPLLFSFGESNDPAADFRSERLNDIGVSVDFIGGDDNEDNTIDEDIEGAGFKPITAAIFGPADDDIPLGRFNFDGSNDIAQQVRDVDQGGTGLRLIIGFEDPDETGFEIEGLWIDGEENIFRRGLNANPNLVLPNEDPTDPLTQFAIVGRQFLELPNLRNAGLIALEAPETSAATGVQTFQLINYDLYFEVVHESEVAGTSLNYYMTPLVKKRNFRIRPQVAFGYHFINERFGFVGESSGIQTTFEDTGTLTDFSSAIGDDGDIDDVEIFAPYSSALTSSVRSHLFGPTIGAGMDIGGEAFLLSGYARTGIAANIENVDIDGFGLGFGQANAFGAGGLGDDDDDDIVVINTFDRQEFSEEQTFSHVSPTFELHLQADAPLLRYVPLINKVKAFDQARFSLGFDFFAAYEVARPVDQIRWVSSDEGGPFIESSRDLFWYLDWTFGVRWDW